MFIFLLQVSLWVPPCLGRDYLKDMCATSETSLIPFVELLKHFTGTHTYIWSSTSLYKVPDTWVMTIFAENDGDASKATDIDNTLWNQMAWQGAWWRPSLGRDHRVYHALNCYWANTNTNTNTNTHTNTNTNKIQIQIHFQNTHTHTNTKYIVGWNTRSNLTIKYFWTHWYLETTISGFKANMKTFKDDSKKTSQ